MMKACLVGAGVTLALIVVPVVHFITGIPSAFIGGYFAGTRAEASASDALLIGGIMAALLVLPVAGVFFTMSLLWGFGTEWLLGLTGAFAVWIFLLGTLGAVIGGNSVRKVPEG